MSLSNEVLADGWEWRGASKVKNGRKHYIRVDGSNFTYVCGIVQRGDFTIKCEGGMPYLKLAVLTHYDDELQRLLKKRQAEIRRNVG